MPAHHALARERRVGRKALAALPLATVSAGMVCCRIDVPPAEVVFVKGLIEAHDGLAGVFAERGGELLLAAPIGREADLAELVRDIVNDVGATLVLDAIGGSAPQTPGDSLRATPGSAPVDRAET